MYKDAVRSSQSTLFWVSQVDYVKIIACLANALKIKKKKPLEF